MKLLKGRLVF